MEPLSIQEILMMIKGNVLKGANIEDKVIKNVRIDSREVSEGSLYIPFIGEKVNGHSFIKDVFEKGAVAALVQKGEDFVCDFPEAILIEVENTKEALQNIAKFYRKKFAIPVIGITGSVGKTTTKEMIASVLSVNLNVLKTQGNYNGQIGAPLTLLNLNSDYEALVLEMGVSEIGEMDILADTVDADFGVITNIGVSHIENFGNVEITRDEKIKILKKENGKYYLNGDNPLLSKTDKENIVYFGMNGQYPFRAEDITMNGETTNFTLITQTCRDSITIPCLGVHNVYNALASIAVASDMGFHLDDIKKGLQNYAGAPMRQQIFRLSNIILIDDSYNASPDSVKSAVNVLMSLKSEGRNILIFADILELGDKSNQIHFDLGKYIALENINVLLTMGEESKFLLNAVKQYSKHDIEVKHFDQMEEIYNFIKENIMAGDKILVKGSRGMGMDSICNFIRTCFH
jgi:UDP-N-acetylmuramoyl-tripeptide--D-alanyl-D-alanine ligase